MYRLYSTLIFLIPSISMLSGLFAAPVGAVLLSSMIIANYKKLDFSLIKDKKLELVFFGWLLLTCIWSIAGLSSITKLATLAITVGGFVLITDPRLLDFSASKITNFYTPLLLGAMVAMILFIIEYKTNGFISVSFRNIFQKSDRHYFALYFLDRGCAVLSMISWPIFYVLLKKKRFVLAIIYFIVAGYILSISDSLASFLAFMLGSITFSLIYLSRMYLIYGLVLSVIAAAIFFPTYSYIQSPRDVSHTYPSIPESGKHRLFIWKFATTKAAEKAIAGWGFNSSPEIPVDEENDMVYFNQYKWYPLPLHPHNNFIQIWLEAGIVGLVLFASILIKFLFSIKAIYKRTKDLVWASAASGAFINFLFIGMISFGLWQMWWISICAIVTFLFIILQSYILNEKN